MKLSAVQPFAAIAVLVLVAGCSMPTGARPGPRAWIDDPLDGVTLDMGPVVVQSHVSSDNGTASAALLINGAQLRVDNAANPSDRLASFTQPWQPPSPGEYILEVLATDSTGNTGRSSTVRVHIVAAVGVGTQAPQAPVQPPVVGPSATFTPAGNANLAPGFQFTVNANCRQGAGIAYEVVTSFQAGDQVTLLGRNEDSSWFWVLIPNTNSRCSAAASTGVVSGPVGGLAFIPSPPLPVVTVEPVEVATTAAPPPVAPPAPGKFSVSTKSCTAAGYIVTLQWGDVKGELGYRVYRDKKLIATLAAGTTSYDDASPDNNSHGYYVEAFNAGGASGSPFAKSDGCVY